MSRELLKRALRFMSVVGCSNDDICELCDEIEAFLTQPEPEPVAQVGGAKAINWFDTHVPKGAYLYTTPPDQSARVAELLAANRILHGELAECQGELAALQVKREPLSSDAIRQLYRTAFPRGPYVFTEDAVVFARAIEAAHGIGG